MRRRVQAFVLLLSLGAWGSPAIVQVLGGRDGMSRCSCCVCCKDGHCHCPMHSRSCPMQSGGSHSQHSSHGRCMCSGAAPSPTALPDFHVEWRFTLGQAEPLMLAGLSAHIPLSSFTFLPAGHHDPPDHPPKLLA